MSDLYKDICFKFTKIGESIKAKQNNGYKYSISTAIPFMDVNNYIKNLYDAGKLDEITTDGILDNLIFITPGNVYTLDHGILTSDYKPHSLASGLPVRTTFDKKDKYCAYSVRFGVRTFTINKFEEDLKFDGIIYLAKEYKTIHEDTNELENNTNSYLPCAITYLFGNDKIELLHDQNNAVVFNVEVRTSLNDDDATVTISTENKSTLHLLDDGTNTNDLYIRPGFGVMGTKDKLYMADLAPAATETYDTYSKLNIMNELGNHDYPQISLQFAANDTAKTWDGARFDIQYSKSVLGNNFFKMSEIKGKNQTKGCNFSLISPNSSASKYAVENSFVYSRDNYISAGSRNMFVNSNDNLLYYGHHNKFTNSTNNTFSGNYKKPEHASMNNSFINAHHNLVTTIQRSIAGTETNAYYALNNASFINTRYSTIKGGSNSAQSINLINSNKSMVNTPYAATRYSQLLMGGEYNYIHNTTSDVVLIGNGLEVINENQPRIVIGNYNDEAKTVNGDAFIIADGHKLNTDFDTKFIDATGNATKMAQFFSSHSGTNSRVRRHNLFVVNSAGYIRIKGNDNSWAQFGVKGITAYNGDSKSKDKWEIDYEDVYDKINTEDAIFRQLKVIDTVIDRYKTELNAQQKSHSIVIHGDIDLNGYKLPVKHNDVVYVTFINRNLMSDTSLKSTISYTMNGAGGFGTRKQVLYNGSTQGFMYVEDTTNNMTGYSRINN